MGLVWLVGEESCLKLLWLRIEGCCVMEKRRWVEVGAGEV